MAERRMFAKTIIDSDAFLDMPLSAQSLYFHLAMRADDDGFINKNPLTLDDSTAAFEKAQKNIKDDASNNKDLLSIAQKRAKVILEENIRQLSGLSDNEYNINWEYGV